MTEEYKRAMDEILLSPEADDRIRAELARVCSLRRQEDHRMKRSPKKMLRTALVAAVLTLLLAVTVYAVSARISMRITRNLGDAKTASVKFEEVGEENDAVQETLRQAMTAGEKSEQELTVYEAQYSFPKEDPGAYIELGYWLPGSIPEGYEEDFVSDRAYGAQVILYKNEAGYTIRFQYGKPSGLGEVTMMGVTAEEAVAIGESEGVLFHKESGGSLFWMRELEGIGFYLTADDPEVDLVAMANSVAACEPFDSPEAEADTEAAIAQLGDFHVTWLPDGFTERDYAGSPVPEDGWYGYVRRFYTDKTTNREAGFFYEPFMVPEDAATADPEEYFLSIHNEDAHVATVIEEATVNGMTGVIFVDPQKNAVYWIDPDLGLEFGVESETLSVEELLQMAESVE